MDADHTARIDRLSRLADMLMKAKDIAQDERDDRLKSLVTQALFRVGQLLAQRLHADGGERWDE